MCKFKSNWYHLTNRCDIFNTMQKYYFTYFYEHKCIDADRKLSVVNYRLKYLFDNFLKCDYMSYFGNGADYNFLDIAIKLYELGGTARRNEAIVIAIDQNNKKLFDSIVLGNNCEFVMNQTTIEKAADRPYYLYCIVKAGFRLSDELLEKCFEKYTKTLMSCRNPISFSPQHIYIFNYKVQPEAKIYFENGCIFSLKELKQIIRGHKDNAKVLIKANYNFTDQFAGLINNLIIYDRFSQMVALMTHLEYNFDFVQSYIKIFRSVKQRSFQIRRSLRLFSKKKKVLDGDPNIEYIVKLFKKVRTGKFLDQHRNTFSKVIKNDILPNYKKNFINKIVVLGDLLNLTKKHLDKYAGVLAIIKHDLCKFVPEDMTNQILLFVN